MRWERASLEKHASRAWTREHIRSAVKLAGRWYEDEQIARVQQLAYPLSRPDAQELLRHAASGRKI